MDIKEASWIILAILSTIVGLYPITHFLIDRDFGLISTKSAELLIDKLLNIAFYGHKTLGNVVYLLDGSNLVVV